MKTLTTQIFCDPASNDTEPDYTDIFIGSTRHLSWRRPFRNDWSPIQPPVKTGIAQSRSSPGTKLEGPQIVSFRAKIDNQFLDRGSPLLVCQVDRDIVAHFVECLLPWLLEIDHFENVKAEAGSDRPADFSRRSEEHTSELQSQSNLVCRLSLGKKNT